MDPCTDLASKKEAADRAVEDYMKARGWRFYTPSADLPPRPPIEVEELNRLVAEQKRLERELADCYGRDM